MAYDSRPETRKHIREVQNRMLRVMDMLAARARVHDASKLREPELSVFDEWTPRLRGLTYGSELYKAALAEMQPALDHHYANNSHHPEHYAAGIAGMCLLDLVEMFCDWAAATMRHADGDLGRSIEINAKRFGIDPQLVSILRNTAERLGWVERTVTVCDQCRRASCWQGEFMCDGAQGAGTVDVPVSVLAQEGREHSDYWKKGRGDG